MRSKQVFPRDICDAGDEWRASTGQTVKRLQALAALVPCAGRAPEGEGRMRKWAAIGLERFYRYFPFRDDDGTLVRRLAPYQYDVWADRWLVNDFGLPAVRYYLKSQKIGQSTLHLLECLHIALSPRCRGREVLIVGQEQVKAEEHLADMTEMLRRSRFVPFLIDGPRRDPRTGEVRRDSQSSASKTTLINPDDPAGTPTEVKAVSITSRGGLSSNKRVEHIHMSDIAVANATVTTIDRGISNAMSRLTKSKGTCVIETMPGSTAGRLYAMYREACRDQLHRRPGADPHRLVPGELSRHDVGIVRRFPWRLAVDQGVTTREKMEENRKAEKSAYEFSRLYEADFLSSDMTAYNNPLRRVSAAAGGILEACMLQTPLAACVGQGMGDETGVAAQ